MEKCIAAVIAACIVLVRSQIQGNAAGDGGISVVDLTHQLNKDTVYWPGNPNLVFTILNRGLTAAGFWYESNKFETAEHGGTHLDAPAHFAEGKWRSHEIPVHRLIGPGVVVNVTDSASRDPDYRLSVSDLTSWEGKHGMIPDGSMVFMMSGWSSKYPQKSSIFNTADVNNSATFHFPGFHPEAIDWLIKNRNISMIGVDTPSTDYGQSTTYEVHVKASKASIMGLENVNNLERIPPNGTTIFVGLVNLYDGSGGPVRILAVIGHDRVPACSCPFCEHNGGAKMFFGIISGLMLLIFLFYRIIN